ncbi:glycosyltransferase [Actinoplanes sp. NPDC051470]|uniref:glycosyltransferase n=1 Tax=Actinoplanes sp. NPDC051470 TaxID=3157224 RepID=UPI0034410B84
MHDRKDLTLPTTWITGSPTRLTSVKVAEDEQSSPVSIVILAKDEERCIARCLDSVIGQDFDDIIVLDTGSTDNTAYIVGDYIAHGVRLLRTPWANSFAHARNRGIDAVGRGWIVFLDADEWLTEEAARRLRPCLMSLSRLENVSRLTFAPEIVHVDRGEYTHDLPRIFKADSAIRFRGQVHEYPVIAQGSPTPVEVITVDIQMNHDGYSPAVVMDKNKRKRNLDLLAAARLDDPDNPRWWYFTVRDGLAVHDHSELLSLCERLKELAGRPTDTGDRRSAHDYYRLALGSACQRLSAMGDWLTVYRNCEDLPGADAFYFRTIRELLGGMVTGAGLIEAIRRRSDEELTTESVVDPSGRHLDAVIVALLEQLNQGTKSKEYRELCAPWTDSFFEESRLRPHYRQPSL